MPVLVEIYIKSFSGFIKHQIEIGKPVEKKPEKVTQPKSIYYDLIEKEKSKHYRESFDDQNFCCNKVIANNLHFFFGSFCLNLETQTQELRAQMHSCILDILEIYSLLLETKDRELMHHVLFSFKNYHDVIARVEVWALMTDEVKDCYQEILKTKIRSCEKIVEFSWRYHATYVKVVETILDS
jgi:hypothetical protein